MYCSFSASNDPLPIHGHLYTGQLSRHFVFRQVDIMGGILGAQLTPRKWIHISNEGSNFILSQLEVGH